MTLQTIFPDGRPGPLGTADSGVLDALRHHAARAGGHERLGRLGELDADQMAMALAFLAGFGPAVFDAVLNATAPCHDDGEAADGYDYEPYCTACTGRAGIFTGLGDNWRHYRGEGTADSKAEPYDAGHAAVIGWRLVKLPPLG